MIKSLFPPRALAPLLVLLAVVVVVLWQRRESVEPAADPAAKLTDRSAYRAPAESGAALRAGSIMEFREWMTHYGGIPAGEKLALRERGVELAKERRAMLKQLIIRDPQRALAEAVPHEVRRSLPAEVVAHLEEPVNATGDYEVLVTCGLDVSEVSLTEHFAVLNDGRRFRAYPYGRRLDVTTKRGIALHGIAVDDIMAIADDPLRVIPQGERLVRELPEGTVQVGSRLFEVGSAEALANLRGALREDEMTLGPRHIANYTALRAGTIEGVVAMAPGEEEPDGGDEGGLPPPPPSAFTEGPKTMLYIRARFADQDPGFVPISDSNVQTRQGACEQFWLDNSYGKSSLTTTITDTVTLTINAPTSSSNKPGLGTLLSNARAAAVAANPAWDHTQFDFTTVITQGGSGWGYAGVAYVGGNGSHLQGSGAANVRTASHEFGHNLGLQHANYWRTDSPSPIGRDGVPGYRGDNANAERVVYGHKFSVMSAQGGGGDFNSNPSRGHYTPGEKVKLDWLGAGEWMSTTTSGTIRLYRHDVPEADHAALVAGARAIKINLDSDDYVSASNRRRYWLTYRRLPTNGIAETWLRRGLQVDWQRNTYGGDGAIQLDMTPFSRDDSSPGGNWTRDNNDKEDAALIIGRTYSDEAMDIHFTPVQQGGSNPNQWIDVALNVGTASGNADPEITSFTASAISVGTGVGVNFTMAATDPDGDTLAYSWDFADNSLVVSALNSTAATKSWSTGGQYVVRATVSDMKGGTDTRDVLITVGTPTNDNFITGRVLRGGVPVEGARVNIGSSYQAWTEGDGTYTLAGLPEGNHIVTAAKYGLTFVPQFTNPVFLSSLNSYGNDFHAVEGLSGSGGLTLAVTPFEVEVPLGASLQFTAEGWDLAGNSIPTSPAWSTTGGGTIDPGGLFTADALGGPFTVTATDGAASAAATVTVVDSAAVGVVVTDAAASEAGSDSGGVRIQRLGDNSTALTVQVSTGGSATSGSDYSAIATSVVLGAGVSSVDVPVVPINDFEEEGSETVVVSLVADAAYDIFAAQASATVVIADDGDVGPEVVVISPTASPALVGPGSGLFLQASATDDGLPNPPGTLSASWSMLSGPSGSSVVFTPPDSFSTAANFTGPGLYRLQVAASDGPNTATAEVVVIAGVEAATNPSTANEDVYYPFNEGTGTTAADLRGGDENGTLANGATWSTGGIAGGALLLDGIDDQVNIADSSAINLGIHPLRTVALWFKADDPNKAAKQALYQEGGGSRGLNIYFEAGALYVGGWNNGENDWNSTYLSTAVTDTEWHHVALVLEAPGTGLQAGAFRGYLDGLPFATGNGAELNEHAGNISIGARRDATQYHDGDQAGAGDRFDGLIDEFRLYNRALSDLEIGQLYGWGAPVAPALGIASVNAGIGSVVIPGGVGMVLDGAVAGGAPGAWQQVTAPAGGAVTFGDGGPASTTATFSAPGYYQMALLSGTAEVASALPVSVHAGIDSPANPATTNQVIYYALDDAAGTTALDGVGGNNNGNLAGGVTWTTAAVAGGAALFDGVDDVIEIANATGINSGNPYNRKTIAMWFNSVAPGATAKEVLFEEGGGTRGLNIYLDGGRVYVGGWNNGLNGWASTYLSAPVTAGQWHHVALILEVPADNSLVPDGLRMFLDGVEVGSGPAAEMSAHSGAIGLGGMRSATVFHDGNGSGTGLFLAGTIDEFHYFNGRVLNVDEIGLLYSFGNIGAFVEAGPDQPLVSVAPAGLAGSSSDDGRPFGSLAHSWSAVSGPGPVDFSEPDAEGIDTLVAFSQDGSYLLRLVADDGQVATFDEVSLGVVLSFYETWVAGFPGMAGPLDDYLDDFDDDSVVNLMEYATGGSPVDATSGGDLLPVESLVEATGETYFEFTYRRRRDAAVRGLTYEVQQTDQPAANPWSTAGLTERAVVVLDAEFELVTVRVDDPISATAPRKLVRLLVQISE